MYGVVHLSAKLELKKKDEEKKAGRNRKKRKNGFSNLNFE